MRFDGMGIEVCAVQGPVCMRYAVCGMRYVVCGMWYLVESMHIEESSPHLLEYLPEAFDCDARLHLPLGEELLERLLCPLDPGEPVDR